MNMMSVHDWLPQWFSESGKLVLKLFEEIRRLVENPRSLVSALEASRLTPHV